MIFFCYIVYELLAGLAAATAQEKDLVIRGKIQTAQVMTVISWYTCPVVYLLPMLGTNSQPGHRVENGAKHWKIKIPGMSTEMTITISNPSQH